MVVSREGSFGKTWRDAKMEFKDRKVVGPFSFWKRNLMFRGGYGLS